MFDGVGQKSEQVAALHVEGLDVRYGASQALHGMNITCRSGIHAIVGRNGMGKTTLCQAIMGLVPAHAGSILLRGRYITGLAPNNIAQLGIGYTPQGRRLWPSLTVDEHLRLCAVPSGIWSVERAYDTFPQLAERRQNGGAELSGGEQQMLAIARALLREPSVLVLDEPTEGLSPKIVEHVVEVLADIALQDNVTVVLVEQNLGVALALAEDVSVMVNGEIVTTIASDELRHDRALQQRFLGVGRNS